MNIQEIQNIIEAILFATGDAISLKQISATIQQDEKTTKKIILNLIEKYETKNSGIKIIQINDSFQMCTNPIYFPYIKNLCSIPQAKGLSQTLLETLAIIAYKQPVTKSQIENIRGVNCDHSINTLIKYNLIEEKGRLDTIGKPIVFGTTTQFLKYFGFSNINEMPNLKDDNLFEN